MQHKAGHLHLVVVDGVRREADCARMAEDHPLFADCNPDDRDRLAVLVMRLICEAFAKDIAWPWDRAHMAAEAVLGLTNGPALVAHMTALLRAIRAERSEPFAYMSALCPGCSQHLTPQERAALDLLREARQGSVEAVGRLAGDLAGSAHAPRIAVAAFDAGRFLGPRHEPKPSPAAQTEADERAPFVPLTGDAPC